jgi:hypothetical protein
VDAEVLGHPVHVQQAEDEQHDSYEADERKHAQYECGRSVGRGLPMMAPSPAGLLEHRQASRHSTSHSTSEFGHQFIRRAAFERLVLVLGGHLQEDTRLLTADQVAERLGVLPSWVAKAARADLSRTFA